jgi:hypothetical protein
MFKMESNPFLLARARARARAPSYDECSTEEKKTWKRDYHPMIILQRLSCFCQVRGFLRMSDQL